MNALQLLEAQLRAQYARTRAYRELKRTNPDLAAYEVVDLRGRRWGVAPPMDPKPPYYEAGLIYEFTDDNGKPDKAFQRQCEVHFVTQEVSAVTITHYDCDSLLLFANHLRDDGWATRHSLDESSYWTEKLGRKT